MSNTAILTCWKRRGRILTAKFFQLSSAPLCRARLQHPPSTVLTWKTSIIAENTNYNTSKHIRDHPGNVGKVSNSLTALQLTSDLPHKEQGNQENPGLYNSTNILNLQSCSTGRTDFAVGCSTFKVTDKRHLWNQN